MLDFHTLYCMIYLMTTLTKTGKKPIAYGYARVSTKKQEAEGYSLEAQTEQIERYCKDKYDLKHIYNEAESGKKADRPKLQEALRLCSLSEGTLVIAKIARLTRDLHFLTKLQNERVKFIALDMPDANETMLQVMVSFAQLDNKLRSTRIKEGMKKAKEKGKKFGTDNLTPYYEKLENEIDPTGRRHEVRKLLEKPDLLSSAELKSLKSEEAKLIQKIRNLYTENSATARSNNAKQRALSILPIIRECQSEGHTSYSQLAKCLTDKGIKTPQGREVWNRSHIQTLMTQLKKLEEY